MLHEPAIPFVRLQALLFGMQGTLGSPAGQVPALSLPRPPPAVDMGDRTGGPELGMWERGMAAGVAAFISTLVVNPLELVKARYAALGFSRPARKLLMLAARKPFLACSKDDNEI